MPENPLPNLIVIGAMKCGTSSLHYNLNLHPEIAMTREKELHFFSHESKWERGTSWYRSQFPTGSTWRGESSPSYTRAPDDRTAARMCQVVPGARLVYIVRNPIERIISHYVQNVSNGTERRSIGRAVSDSETSDYLLRSRYHFQLSQFLRHFPESQIHVLTLEDLHKDPDKAMAGIFRFLDVDDGFSSPEFSVVRHKSSDKGKKNRAGRLLKRLSNTKAARLVPTDTRMRLGSLLYKPFSKKMERPEIDPKIRQDLQAYLEEDIAKLEDQTGLDLGHWRV